jgi:alanine dehydrogenase
MKDKFSEIKTIGLAKEAESPENPGGLEKRVAMIPDDIKALVACDCKVFVENGAGDGIGYSDDDYKNAGATLQSVKDIYLDKDMVIKFKGPSMAATELITPKTILFCMAHFRSFPERAKLMQGRKINVIAMEEILESPKFIPDELILSKCFVEETLRTQETPYEELHVGFIGYDKNMIGGIRRAGNRDPKSQCLYQKDIKFEELHYFGESALYFYDSRLFTDLDLMEKLESLSCQVFDLRAFKKFKGKVVIDNYRRSHKPFQFGGRRIQCLHETGMAGARYGLKLLNKEKDKVNATILGYGNVGMGAIRECYDKGVRVIQILGRTHTAGDKIADFIKNSNLIISGAEQPPELRGVNYLIKRNYVGTLIQKGSVVIDLVGGSATNRSAVEDIVECSYLTDPHFVRDGVTFSGLWGWPMMGLMKESALTYSAQTLEVLTGKENLLKGLDHLPRGVKCALVCGPF